MKLMLICSAEGPMPSAPLSSADYAAARRNALSAAACPPDAKPLQAAALPVYLSGAPSARAAAAVLCPGAAPLVHGGLEEAAPVPGPLSGAALPLPLRAWLDAPRGEALREARRRAEALAEELERAGKDCVLFSHPLQIPLLMDAFRVRGYCFARSGLGAIRPGERILVTSRTAHCGGCGHNCMLSSPGCGIGRDKAQRAGIPYTMKLGEDHGTDKK